MPGKIVKVAVRDGDAVGERELLVVLEAMKMEHRIEATADAVVESVLVKEGQIVAAGTPLVTLSGVEG
jgi:biotin carboxyl carrier protein